MDGTLQTTFLNSVFKENFCIFQFPVNFVPGGIIDNKSVFNQVAACAVQATSQYAHKYSSNQLTHICLYALHKEADVQASWMGFPGREKALF